METFRKTGDSLAGRFFTHHLLPLSLAELREEEIPDKMNLLIERSGFPEPFLAVTNGIWCFSTKARNSSIQSLTPFPIWNKGRWLLASNSATCILYIAGNVQPYWAFPRCLGVFNRSLEPCKNVVFGRMSQHHGILGNRSDYIYDVYLLNPELS